MSFNVVSSEPCPYHENGPNSQVECRCTVGDETSLGYHVEFKGSFKKAFYGLVGTQKDVDIVHQKLKSLQKHSGVYTLIMNCDDNRATIEKEIQLFGTIEKVDPDGDFTPILLHYNRIYRGTPDDMALQKICVNVRAYQK